MICFCLGTAFGRAMVVGFLSRNGDAYICDLDYYALVYILFDLQANDIYINVVAIRSGQVGEHALQ